MTVANTSGFQGQWTTLANREEAEGIRRNCLLGKTEGSNPSNSSEVVTGGGGEGVV